MDTDQLRTVQRCLDIGNAIEHKNQKLVKLSDGSGTCVSLELVNGQKSEDLNDCFKELQTYLRDELEASDEKNIPYELSPVQYDEDSSNDINDISYSFQTALRTLVPGQRLLKSKIINMLNRFNTKIINATDNRTEMEIIESTVGVPCFMTNCIGKCIKIKDCARRSPREGASYFTERISFPRLLPPKVYECLEIRDDDDKYVERAQRYLDEVLPILASLQPTGPCLYCAIFKQKTDHNPLSERITLLGITDFDRNKYMLKFFTNFDVADIRKNTRIDESIDNSEEEDDDDYDDDDDEENEYDDDNLKCFVSYEKSIKPSKRNADRKSSCSSSLLDKLTFHRFDNEEYGLKHENLDIYL